ncbi:hypothetical protein IPA_01565 [Ignicoccus pacificus DSM 13166]|uniref:Uncharacterized protein n=1 Tax=Ignicoccus pacificus DSM 13166 TaxID=940294 RepID=A0A977K942_9CREN|nr:hypothetical protein IPA_01565 [Ignicoccus pacificus DSM 13166]
MPKDFLRQIVNPTLLEFEIPAQVLIEIRKKIEAAENKYNFSAFGGDVKNLVKFLQSPEWKELVALFEAANAKVALIKILENAKEAYKDYPEVVKAIEEALKALEKGEEVKAITKLEELKKNVEKALEGKYPTRISENKVVVESDKLEAYIEEDSGEYKMKVEVRGTKVTATWEEAKKILQKAKELADALNPP